ncbi:MAG: acetyl-CoA C-acetyltransferase [Deltaproteobacteria bacterium]|nr:MAG: acetyl-CoA C-acetyltransferase [Deltaproteobacteria bacterium]
MSTPAFIFDAIRTPRGKGKKDGSLHEVKPVDLLASVLKALQSRYSLDTARIDDLIVGCVMPVGEQGSNIAKTAAMVAGWDEKVPGLQIERFCASSLDATAIAAMKIMSGWEQLIVAGGVESMSHVPIGANGGPWAEDPATSMITGFVPQGIGADLIATLEGFSREDVDAFAVESQKKADAAQKAGYFNKSVVPVTDENGLVILDHDEFIRPGTTVEGLSKLKPAFEFMGTLGFDAIAISRYPNVERINHVHHAGNSSGIVDGACAMLLGSEKIGKELGLKPRGRVVASSVVSTEPTIMLTGPIAATKKVLDVAGLRIDQIDLFEVNEAFAAVPILYQRDFNVPWEKINVNGGAIAMGHPLGATGGMILGTVLDELERRGLTYGLCTMCAGGGIGIATIVERLSSY